MGELSGIIKQNELEKKLRWQQMTKYEHLKEGGEGKESNPL